MNDSAEKSNKICGRMCIEITGCLGSPLSVGSGEQGETDADVILSAWGAPFIPGSAIAGSLRAYSKKLGLGRESDQLFGAPDDVDPGSESDRQSRIFCYDTFLEKVKMSIRDGVKLEEKKTPRHKSKYEMQIIERGAKFRMRLEIIERKACMAENKDIQKVWNTEQTWIRRWAQGFEAGELRIGAKSNRGFGKLEIEEVRVKKFNMEVKDEYLAWLDWKWDHEHAFEQAEFIDFKMNEEETKNFRAEHVLEVPLRIPNTLLVRTYSETFGKAEDVPDYGQLTVSGKGEQAVIPGSSFAGAFRSHIAKIVNSIAHLHSWEEAQKRLEPFFGTWTEEKKRDEKLVSSRVIFEEVLVNGGHSLPITRNSIDRFTGGTIKGALFEEVPWAGGTALLRIRWKKDKDKESNIYGNISDPSSKVICGMLLWSIKDLQAGILSIGGETAVGRGIFCRPDEKDSDILLDGNALDEKTTQEYMQMAASWCKGGEYAAGE